MSGLSGVVDGHDGGRNGSNDSWRRPQRDARHDGPRAAGGRSGIGRHDSNGSREPQNLSDKDSFESFAKSRRATPRSNCSISKSSRSPANWKRPPDLPKCAMNSSLRRRNSN